MMKKLLSILLVLALLLPAAALAQETKIDVGNGFLLVGKDYTVQLGEKKDGYLLAQLIRTNGSGESITVQWSSESLPRTLSAETAATYANNLLTSAVLELNVAGVNVSGAKVVSSDYDAESGYFTMYMTSTEDYAQHGGAKLTIHRIQRKYEVPDDGSYTVLMTSTSEKGVNALLDSWNGMFSAE